MASKRYKVWVQIEELDDEADEYENVSEPICIWDGDSLESAEDLLFGLSIQQGQGFDQDEIRVWMQRRLEKAEAVK